MRQTSLFSVGITPNAKRKSCEQATSKNEQSAAKPSLPYKIVNIIDINDEAKTSTEDGIQYEEFLGQWQMQNNSAWAFVLRKPSQALVRIIMRAHNVIY